MPCLDLIGDCRVSFAFIVEITDLNILIKRLTVGMDALFEHLKPLLRRLKLETYAKVCLQRPEQCTCYSIVIPR